ncbi:MAG: dihydropteroate synthase [Actinomycetota bacterium]
MEVASKLGTAWRCRDRELPVFERVQVMGIVNVTPDSFSDGGNFLDHSAAAAHGLELVAQGADIIDVGGESTRPGAEPVQAEQETERVIPVIRSLLKETDVPVAVDTTKAEVAEAAIDAGAVIVNDVSAMRFDPRMRRVVAASGAGVILMHMQGEPRTMQDEPHYEDVVNEVSSTLGSWALEAEDAGVAPESIAIDPGIGFGKTVGHNLSLLKDLGAMANPERLGVPADRRYPIVVGPSRKSFIGKILNVEVDQRLEGTAVAVAWAVDRGANIVRVHDVGEMARVVRMAEAIRGA